MGDAQTFLETLFDTKPGDTEILIWTLPDKKSYWCTSPKAAAQFAEKLTKKNVYFGIGLSPEDYGPDKRCLTQDIAAIPGLWIDIDIKGEGHKKQNLPENMDAALDFLAAAMVRPTIVVSSGHGLQAYWLFEALWVFNSPEERAAAENLTWRWKEYFRGIAAKAGLDVDSTHDLARVYRMPGTMNVKNPDNPQPCKILEINADLRYNQTDINALLDEAGIAKGAPQSQKRPAPEAVEPQEADGFTLNPKADYPVDKFELLGQYEPNFLLSWNNKRKDFQDQSPSTYDLSLASYAVAAGWSEQEIVNLLIAHRRLRGHDLKLRPDYYRRTLARAKTEVKTNEFFSDAGNAPDDTKPEENAKESLLDNLSAVLNVRVNRIVKYLTDPANYEMETNRGTIKLGKVTGLINQAELRNKLAEVAGVIIPRFEGKKWDKIAQSLLDACDPVEYEAGTVKGQARALLTAYFEDYPVFEDIAEAVPQKMPFMKDGARHIFLDGFSKWLRVNGREASNIEIGDLLRSIGCKDLTIAVTLEKGRTTRYCWRVPEEF